MSKPISILLVEDSELDADLTLEELRRGEILFETRRVDTREQYESALIEQEPDIILSDYSLPRFDGMSALRLARQYCPDAPFIFVSGVIGEEIAIESLKYGATDYVLKHRIQRLLPAFSRALQNAEERKARKKAQEALRRSEERLRLAVKTARLGTWDLDVSTGQVEASPIGKEHFGLSPEAGIAYHTLRSAIHPDDRDEVAERIQQALDHGGTYEAEYRVLWPDQSIHWLVTQGVPIRDQNGSVSRMVNVTLDITARKQVEENLAKQARELTAFNDDLRQFAYAASHDLQEPLRMVTVYAQLVAQGYKDKLGEDAGLYFSFIETGTSRMSALLRDLLAYLQLQTTERRLDIVNMDHAVGDVLRVLDVAIKQANATVTADPLPQVAADESQMEQVLQNLVSNALKYRGSRPPEIHISAEREGDRWVISVRDNGIGFDQNYAEQVFGLFKRLNRDYEGTGLGLAICRRIVEHHGGKIWAKSEPGVGSTFSFSLPAQSVRTSAVSVTEG